MENSDTPALPVVPAFEANKMQTVIDEAKKLIAEIVEELTKGNSDRTKLEQSLKVLREVVAKAERDKRDLLRK